MSGAVRQDAGPRPGGQPRPLREDPMNNPPRVALFDLDHTLLPIDSDYAWGQFTITIGWTDAAEFGRRNEEFFVQYQAGTLDVHDYVRFAIDAVRRHGPADAAAAHRRFMREVVQPNLRPDARALIDAHRNAGDRVAIVTATNEFVTRPIADAFGVADLIAIELERGEGGWFTGEIRGVPSFRDGKVARVEQWLAAQGLALAEVDSTFYSDSVNDLALLERVQHPVATNPDARLRALAIEQGWRILNLFPRLD